MPFYSHSREYSPIPNAVVSGHEGGTCKQEACNHIDEKSMSRRHPRPALVLVRAVPVHATCVLVLLEIGISIFTILVS